MKLESSLLRPAVRCTIKIVEPKLIFISTVQCLFPGLSVHIWPLIAAHGYVAPSKSPSQTVDLEENYCLRSKEH